MELDYKSIGKRIRTARINKAITQEKLSEIITLSPTHMSNIETGTTKVSLTTIVKLANALSVTVDDLLCDNLIASKIQFEKDMQSTLNDCTDYEFRLICDMAESLKNSIRKNNLLH